MTELQTETVRGMVQEWLEAIHRNDLDGVVACFTETGTWQNVPSPPAVGRDEIRAMLAPVFERSERIVWDIVTESYSTDCAWLERVDRFFIDGTEHAVQCNGVLEFDAESGLIANLRDYVDLAEWRSRISRVF